MAQRDDASTSRHGARAGSYFVAPLDPSTIQRQAALRRRAGHRRAAFAHHAQGDVDGQRYESVIRLGESWEDVIRRYGTSADADSDDVVDLVDWGIVEDRGRLRRQMDEENRRLVALSRATSSTGDPADEDDRSGSDDELAIPSPAKAAPVDRRGEHGEAPVSRRFQRLELLRADDLDDLRRFLQDERRARRASSQIWEDVSDAESDEAGSEVEAEVEDVSRNRLSGSAPILVDDDSEDDLDLVSDLPKLAPRRVLG